MDFIELAKRRYSCKKFDSRQISIAIDLKSMYVSVECVDRGLDPLTTNLVVADVLQTDKTICLAVTPSLKAYGIGGRARLFEVIQRLREVNYERQMKSPSKWPQYRDFSAFKKIFIDQFAFAVQTYF